MMEVFCVSAVSTSISWCDTVKGTARCYSWGKLGKGDIKSLLLLITVCESKITSKNFLTNFKSINQLVQNLI